MQSHPNGNVAGDFNLKEVSGLAVALSGISGVASVEVESEPETGSR